MEIIRLVDSLPFFVFKHSFIFANKDDSKNTLNLIFIFVNFRSERTICRLTLNSINYRWNKRIFAQICPSICYYVVHLRGKKSVHVVWASHPYSQMVDKKSRGMKLAGLIVSRGRMCQRFFGID